MTYYYEASPGAAIAKEYIFKTIFLNTHCELGILGRYKKLFACLFDFMGGGSVYPEKDLSL